MSYHDLSSCTLTDDERLEEKDELLGIIFDSGRALEETYTHKELVFLYSIVSASSISVKQLFWLRDLKDKVV